MKKKKIISRIRAVQMHITKRVSMEERTYSIETSEFSIQALLKPKHK
jgi:hypothetical protein